MALWEGFDGRLADGPVTGAAAKVAAELVIELVRFTNVAPIIALKK
jgi:hypothetical protein